MMQLSNESEALALQLAAAQGVPVQAAIQRALENEARVSGVLAVAGSRRRMTVAQMLAVGAEITALPLCDPRSPGQIMDELNAQ